MLDLTGKRVLFFSPRFFGYEKDIVGELSRRGATVDFLPDVPVVAPMAKAAIRLRRELFLPLMDRFFFKAVKDFGRSHYDYIFVVIGEGISEHLLEELKRSFPTANLVLYLWDALGNRRLLDRNLSHFDRCVTFDPQDARRYGMQYRPLFFGPGYAKTREVKVKFHLSFIGTAHSDRYRVASNVRCALPLDASSYFYLYLQAPWVYFVRRFGTRSYRGASFEDFQFEPLAKEVVHKIFDESLSILDIEHPRQLGLTMRTFEALGARKKLITTNGAIRETDFYDPNNIFVIDRLSVPDIPGDFFRTPYAPLSRELYEKYSIQGWLNEVLLA